MPTPARKKASNGPGAIALVAFLALVTVAVMIVGNKLFVVKTIRVEGNRFCSAEEVIQSSGLSYGDNMFSIDTAKVKNGVNSNRYLQFVGLWRDFPSNVVLTVAEHSPRATLHWAGMLVMLDEYGVVLEHTSQTDIMQHMLVITGMQVETVRVGQIIGLSVPGQLDAIKGVLAELDRQGLAGEISELNVAVLDNLYLVTEDGLQIALGTDERLPEKIALAQTVLPRLRSAWEVRGGVLDISAAESADFRPPQ